jgi:hypothetical protein
MVALASSGTWEVDDTNQTDYPIMMTNIVANQQDYSFTIDETLNQVLDIFRVEIKDANGNWQLVEAYDEYAETTSLSQQQTETGTPTRYSKTANGIFLDRTPSYNSTNGLKIYYARTPSYFTITGGTTVSPTKPGIPDMFHRYLSFKPAYHYCLAKGLPQAQAYKLEVDQLEKAIEVYHSQRTRDEKPRMRVLYSSTR